MANDVRWLLPFTSFRTIAGQNECFSHRRVREEVSAHQHCIGVGINIKQAKVMAASETQNCCPVLNKPTRDDSHALEVLDSLDFALSRSKISDVEKLKSVIVLIKCLMLSVCWVCL